MPLTMTSLIRRELRYLADQGYFDPETEMLNPSLLAYLGNVIELVDGLGADLWRWPDLLVKAGQQWAAANPGQPIKVPFTWQIG